jgi:predicted O-methyltransferase YrrM
VKPWEIVERSAAPDGTELVLARRDDEWVVRLAGRTLMSSRMHGSEDALAALALARVTSPRTVLIGGLGLGYTLRATLDRLPPDARVVMVELAPAVVAWNRGPLAHLAGRPLEDPRVRLQQDDVVSRIAEAHGAYDAILLDVDNGPSEPLLAGNAGLYGERGLRACAEALRVGGVLGIWSAGPEDRFLPRLERAGLVGTQVPVSPRGEAGRARHAVILGQKRAGRPRAAIPGKATTPPRPSARPSSPAGGRTARGSGAPGAPRGAGGTRALRRRTPRG